MEIIRPGTTFDFLGKTRIALTVSAVLLSAIWIAVPFRVNLGVDFSGGTEIEVKFTDRVGAEEVRKKVEAAGFTDATVQQYGPSDENSYLVRVERITLVSPEQRVKLEATLREKLSVYGLQSVEIDPDVGDKIDIRAEKVIPLPELKAAVEAGGVELAVSGEAIRDLTRAELPSYQVVTRGLSDKVSASLKSAFGADKVEVRRVEYVGPQVGAQLRNRGIMAVLLSMVAILIYVAFRFQPAFAPGGVVALFHDITIVMGYYVITGREFNLTSIAVLLTIVGYSINDTIVIFDRVREVMGRKSGKSITDVINLALNETLSRTLLTSGVTALSLIGLLVYGVGSIKDFAWAMMVGLVSGTYSTIYIASPLAIWIYELLQKREAARAAAGLKPGSKPLRKPAHSSAD